MSSHHSLYPEFPTNYSTHSGQISESQDSDYNSAISSALFCKVFILKLHPAYSILPPQEFQYDSSPTVNHCSIRLGLQCFPTQILELNPQKYPYLT